MLKGDLRMTSKNWPTIRKRTETVKGRVYTYWLVDCGNVQGVRKRHSYKTRREAEKKAEQLRRERSRIGFSPDRTQGGLKGLMLTIRD
jgi:hypothetical protein